MVFSCGFGSPSWQKGSWYPFAVQTPPLPPYTFSTPRLSLTDQKATWDKQPFRFSWGDLKITATTATYDGKTKTLIATGNIVVVRGDERIVAEKLLLEGLSLFGEGLAVNDLSLLLEKTTLLSPPFYLTGERVALKHLTLEEGTGLRFVPGPDGRGEVALVAERVTGAPETRRLTFRNTTIRLYGARVLTVPRLTITPSPNRRQQGVSLSLPVTFRSTRLSGPTFGVRLPFAPMRGLSAIAHVESSSRQGLQSLFTVHHELLSVQKTPLTSFLTNAMQGPVQPSEDRIRGLITARVPPPSSSRSDGYQDRQVTLPVVVHHDTHQPRLTLEASMQNNREFLRRNASLLLKKAPEVRLLGRVPQGGQGGGIVAELSVGEFEETQVLANRVRRQTGRLQTVLGWEAPVVRVADAGRVLFTVTATEQHYRGARYEVHEARLGGDYSFSTRSGLGGGVIVRDVSGRSPFLFDTIEAQTEGQLRGQAVLGPYLLGAVGRWDLKTHTLFDSEISLSRQGKTLEPRVSWRSQNQTFSFSVIFPGLSGN